MQTVYVACSGNYNDVLSYYTNNYSNAANGYKYFRLLNSVELEHNNNTVDFLIKSIHDNLIPPVGVVAQHTIDVISYVPDMNSAEWANFYVGLCLSKIIACDSVVAKQLDGMSFPNKPKILLDGVNPPRRASINAVRDDIPIFIDGSQSFINGFKSRTKSGVLGFEVVDNFDDCLVFFGTRHLGQLLSNTLAANRRAWLRHDDMSTMFLDPRETHKFGPKIDLINQYGYMSNKEVSSLLDSIVEELSTLLAFEAANPLPTYSSTMTFVDRIMNELNRAM